MPCPDCGVAMTVEDGLWYCAVEDAYHGEADEEDLPVPHKPHYVSFGFTDDEIARGEDFGRWDFPNLRSGR